MTLAALIRKRESRKVATAIPAISATQTGGAPGTVARIATVAVANPTEWQTANPALPDPAANARRLKVVAMLAENPAIERAVFSAEDRGAFVVAVAIRGVGTCELRISKDRYDGFRLMDLLDRCGRLQ